VFGCDRGTGSYRECDFDRTKSGEFVVNLPPGKYFVTLYLGDIARTKPDEMFVTLEGKSYAVATKPKSIVQKLYNVTVTDGQLNVVLRASDAKNSWAAIAAMDVLGMPGVKPTSTASAVAAGPSDGPSKSADLAPVALLAVADYAAIDDNTAHTLGGVSATDPPSNRASVSDAPAVAFAAAEPETSAHLAASTDSLKASILRPAATRPTGSTNAVTGQSAWLDDLLPFSPIAERTGMTARLVDSALRVG
jgi:hypothetical protein